MKQRTLVAYAGRAEATDTLRQLVARSRGEVVTLTVDLGQGGDLQQVRETALACGAARAHVIDAREPLARDYALPALRAGLPPDGAPALIRSLGDAVLAARLQEVAGIEQAAIHDRDLHQVDANILGRVAGDGWRLTREPAAAPATPAVVTVTFERGVPMAINDVPMPLLELIESLATIAGEHGVGRIDGVEAPAAVVLAAALQAQTHGDVRMKFFKGTCAQVPELVASLRSIH
jgi:argininosuccinate synthase